MRGSITDMDNFCILSLQFILALIKKLLGGQPKPDEAVSLFITIGNMPVGQSIVVFQKETNVMSITLRDDFVLPLVVTGLDTKGKPAQIEGLSFASSDETIAKVDPNGLVVPQDNLGTAQVTVKADTSIGPDTKIIMGTVDIDVVGGEAVTLNIGGTPVPADTVIS